MTSERIRNHVDMKFAGKFSPLRVSIRSIVVENLSSTFTDLRSPFSWCSLSHNTHHRSQEVPSLRCGTHSASICSSSTSTSVGDTSVRSRRFSIEAIRLRQLPSESESSSPLWPSAPLLPLGKRLSQRGNIVSLTLSPLRGTLGMYPCALDSYNARSWGESLADRTRASTRDSCSGVRAPRIRLMHLDPEIVSWWRPATKPLSLSPSPPSSSISRFSSAIRTNLSPGRRATKSTTKSTNPAISPGFCPSMTWRGSGTPACCKNLRRSFRWIFESSIAMPHTSRGRWKVSVPREGGL
mmetsp:Transcript_58964/g.125249  ORF Transcript_58964/g.125249 Transcript_58964/m.125249 type:complete len:296 (-) Transcript_58964:1650-2537(-)